MSHGMTINGFHTRRDWNLNIEDNPIPEQPEVNEYIVEVPGGNGFINLTDSLVGEPTYSARKGSWTFTMLCAPEETPSRYSEIANAIHGKHVKVVLDDDPGYYYDGIVRAGGLSGVANGGSFDVKYTLSPFKTSVDDTVIVVDLDNGQTIDTPLDFVEKYKHRIVSNKTVTGYVYDFESKGLMYADFSHVERFLLSIVHTVDANPARYPGISFFDDSGNYYSQTLDTHDMPEYIPAETVSGAGVNLERITSIKMSNPYTEIMVTPHVNAVSTQLGGCSASIVPDIYSEIDGNRAYVDGHIINLGLGLNVNAYATIPRVGTTAFFTGAGTLTIKYRKKWL